MDIFRITVSVDARNLEILMKTGIVATLETGLYENQVEIPESRLRVIVGQDKQGFCAWVQVTRLEEGEPARILHEGWIHEQPEAVSAVSTNPAAWASLSRVSNPSAEVLKCQEDASFASSECCTAYGNGCYVRCCNSCCSDPARCPGASCCA